MCVKNQRIKMHKTAKEIISFYSFLQGPKGNLTPGYRQVNCSKSPFVSDERWTFLR